jgi:hypothetical protein
MMTGIGVHHRSESLFTFDRNHRSQWSGLRITEAFGLLRGLDHLDPLVRFERVCDRAFSIGGFLFVARQHSC